MRITRISQMSGKENSMELNVNPAQIFAWNTGTLAQNAFPDLTPPEREFVMTGITPDEWTEMFGPEDEELDNEDDTVPYNAEGDTE